MENPNAYDDTGFTAASIRVNDSIGALWEAGASLGDITEVVSNALENCCGVPVDVTLEPV